MKKILTFFLILIFAFLLVGCEPENESANCTENEPSRDYGSATVFAPGDTVQLVGSGSDGRALADKAALLLDGMLSVGGGGAYIGSEYSMNAPLELIVGLKDESRPATVAAYRILEGAEKEGYFDMRYVVYADGGCIAIAFDENEYTALSVADVIGDELLSKLFADKEYVAYPKGVILEGRVDLIEKQKLIDSVEKAEEWQALEDAYGKEFSDACKKFYTVFDEKLPLWVANLYDPGIGGFYASSGGRDGAEFGPDLQCTVQLLRFIVQTGMVDNIGTGWEDFLPEFMQQQMIYFAKSLQHTNGYFYHPQWGKDAVDAVISRRGRDLSWGKTLLSEFGYKPAYQTPDGDLGDGITAEEYWQSLTDSGQALSDKPYSWADSPRATDSSGITQNLGNDTADAVAKIALTSSVSLTASYDTNTYLDSHVNFINYIIVRLVPGIHRNPYAIGNEIGSAGSVIRQASEQLGVYRYTVWDCKNTEGATEEDYKRYDGKTIVEMLTDTLVEHINPETGLWGDLTAEEPYGTEFRYTNGFMKTIGSLTSNNVAYPAEYVAKAASALVAGILGDEKSTSNCCDIYNVWTCISLLKSNLKLIEDEALREEVEASVDEILAENAAEAILNTFEKIKGYKKYDGGFAHDYYKGTGVHQNLPVGNASLNQSDVDGTCISSTGLRRAMFEALNVSNDIIPKMYYESDWMMMLEVFISQGPVIKYSYDGEQEETVHDFEAEIPSSKYLSCYNNGKAENSLSLVTLGERSVGKVTKFTKNAQFYMDWKPNYKKANATVTYFEFDMCLGKLSAASEPIELRFYDGNNATTRIYTLYIYAKGLEEGTPVYVAPKSDSSKKIEIGKVGEWFDLRLAYYQGTEDHPAAFKVYANGKENAVIVDEKFENGSEIPASNVSFARFLTMGNFSGEFYLDDLTFAQDVEEYVYEKPTHNQAADTPDTPQTPSGGSTTATKDGKITFDGATSFPIKADNGVVIKNATMSGWKGNLEFAKEDDNTFLRFNDLYKADGDAPVKDSGQPVLLIELPDDFKTGDTFVFEAKFRSSPLADGSFTANSYSFDLTLRDSEGNRVYRTYYGDGDIGLNDKQGKVNNVWNVGEWVALRLEYTVIGADAESASWDVKAYINGELADSSSDKTAHIFCRSKDIRKVGIILSGYYQGLFDIDDIKIYAK